MEFKMQNIKVELIEVTPKMASNWLASNLQNRTISRDIVKAYSDEMIAGRWVLTNQGVAFYENGVLADGQHRLLAIVNSGKTIPMIVTRGLSEESIKGIDQHRARSVRDTVNMTSGHKLSLMDFATIRISFGIKKTTASSMDAIVPNVALDINKVNSWFKKSNSKIHNAIVKSAVLLAYSSGVDSNKLKQFVSVLCTGIPESSIDNIVLLLRDKLMNGSLSIRGDGDREIALKTIQWVISKYVANESISRISKPKDLAYRKLIVK